VAQDGQELVLAPGRLAQGLLGLRALGEPPRPLVGIDAEEIGDLLRRVSVVDALAGETTAVFQDCGGGLWFSCGSIMRTTS
jgi:hypothetical protein